MSKPIERRMCVRPIEIREAANGTIDVRGYAAVFDSESFGEVVKSTAFNRTLAQRDDVRLLVNHGGVPIARTKSGTLTISVDDVGLLIEANGLDPANPTVQELRSAMARGDIDQMSFAFEAFDDPVVDGVRELREVKLYDVSIVTYPWYDATSVELNKDTYTNAEVRALLAVGITRNEDGDEPDAVLDAEPIEADPPAIEATGTPLLNEARVLLGLDPAA